MEFFLNFFASFRLFLHLLNQNRNLKLIIKLKTTMEEDCVCLFCQRDDLNLYEINQNSILIGSDLVDFNEIIFEIFYAQVFSFCFCQ